MTGCGGALPTSAGARRPCRRSRSCSRCSGPIRAQRCWAARCCPARAQAPRATCSCSSGSSSPSSSPCRPRACAASSSCCAASCAATAVATRGSPPLSRAPVPHKPRHYPPPRQVRRLVSLSSLFVPSLSVKGGLFSLCFKKTLQGKQALWRVVHQSGEKKVVKGGLWKGGWSDEGEGWEKGKRGERGSQSDIKPKRKKRGKEKEVKKNTHKTPQP